MNTMTETFDQGMCRCGREFCCGCRDHPAGPPTGWAARLWGTHDKSCPAGARGANVRGMEP